MAVKLPPEVSTLIDFVTNDDIESVKSGSKLKLGNLYLWVYQAKYANELEYWDQLPLVVLLDIPGGKYILGINTHYIPYTYRLQFMKGIQSKGTKIRYADIIKAWKAAKIPTGYAALAIRKYLISHIKSNIRVFESKEDQYEIIKNVLPHFKKKQMSAVYKEINKKLAAQRKKK
jgi:hypothetical protein